MFFAPLNVFPIVLVYLYRRLQYFAPYGVGGVYEHLCVLWKAVPTNAIPWLQHVHIPLCVERVAKLGKADVVCPAVEVQLLRKRNLEVSVGVFDDFGELRNLY